MGSLAKELRRVPRQIYETWQTAVSDIAEILKDAMRWQPFTHISSVTAARVANANGVYLCDATGGAFTLTLAEQNRAYITAVKVDAGGNAVTVQGTGTINGSASVSLASQWDKVTVVCDGTNWIQV